MLVLWEHHIDWASLVCGEPRRRSDFLRPSPAAESLVRSMDHQTMRNGPSYGNTVERKDANGGQCTLDSRGESEDSSIGILRCL